LTGDLGTTVAIFWGLAAGDFPGLSWNQSMKSMVLSIFQGAKKK
jgi:hypothetical protein